MKIPLLSRISSVIFRLNLAVILLLVPILSNACFYRDRSDRPNIVIILIDALRRDHTGVYGCPLGTTPELDRFARTALTVPDVISQCSWTSPSVASLFTMLYPSVHGVISFSQTGQFTAADILDPGLTTIAEIAKNAGYDTAAFVANKWIARECGFHQGFDVFHPLDPVFKPRADSLNRYAGAWLSGDRSRPFFIFLHYMDVHGPYNPPGPFDRIFTSDHNRKLTEAEQNRLKYLSAGPGITDLNFYIDRYNGEIRYADRYIGNLLRLLQHEDLYGDSIVVITSDHGEAFFEHGHCDHGWTLYNEEIEVPFLIRFPQRVHCPEIPDVPVELKDMIRLVFHAAGIAHPALHKPLISGPVFTMELSETVKDPPKRAVIHQGYKGICPVSEGKIAELFDRRSDPGEQINRLECEPAVRNALGELMAGHLEQTEKQRRLLGIEPLRMAPINPRQREQLKSLGYLD